MVEGEEGKGRGMRARETVRLGWDWREGLKVGEEEGGGVGGEEGGREEGCKARNGGSEPGRSRNEKGGRGGINEGCEVGVGERKEGRHWEAKEEGLLCRGPTEEGAALESPVDMKSDSKKM